MAGYAHGDNNFSDDDLDDIPLGDLQELENNAIQFTQAATQSRLKPAAPSSDYGDDFDDEDLDDAVVIDESRSTPVNHTASTLTLPGPSTQTQRATSQLPQRYGSASGSVNHTRPNVPLFPSRPLVQPAVIPRGSLPTVRDFKDEEPIRPIIPGGDGEAEFLRQQLEELRRQNQALEQSIHAKAGEVAIVRSKQEKEAKEHERALNSLRKLSEEKLAKQKKELEAARISASNAATERDFVKQDLAETVRVRSLHKAAEKKDLNVTPKKKKTLAHRDGFDDDEIQVLSPSKLSPSKFRGRNGTPSKAGKRKRKAVESPAPALDVIQAEESFEEQAVGFPVFDEAMIARLAIQDDRFDFLGTMLDHRREKDQLRTIEQLGTHKLPSQPDESFQSTILGTIPTLGLKRPITDLPIEFCELIISLWSKCMDEKYYKPIHLFIDWLMLALELKTTLIAPPLVDTLLPLTQRTTELVMLPRYKGKPMEEDAEVIDVSSCLELLHLTALGCMSEREHITRFWRLMITGTVCMALSYKQPLEQAEIMLRILSTSVLPDSFGMVILGDSATNSQHTGYVLDYLSDPLYGTRYKPREPDDEVDLMIPIETHRMHKFKIEVLQLLTSMTRSPYASSAMAAHQWLIPRLVSGMSDELDVLYNWDTGHESSALIITLSTRLLYFLVTKHEGEINMQQKLSQINGASHKYLLVLARLNFSEDDLLLESGVADDVPRLALEMLEGAVTPDEGDQILSAFLPA